jgi:serine/threonine protein kinase/class 3 adenylate cyclase
MNLGPYQLSVHQGPGFCGEWYLAQTENSGSSVRLLANWDTSTPSRRWEAVARRFRVVAQISHPSAVRVIELCLDHQPPYAVMASPKGIPLEEHLRLNGPVQELAALDLAFRLTGALAEAHRLGLAHGRLTPAEIWITQTFGVCLDFASVLQIAQPEGSVEDASAPSDDRAYQTVHAEDDLLSDSLAKHEDIRALGIVLRAMVGGKSRPGGRQPQPPRNSKDVESFGDLVECMLQDDPDSRPTAEDLLRCIERLRQASQEFEPMRTTDGGGLNDVAQELEPGFREDFADRGNPAQLGRFRLLKKLGEGGLGVVYLAEDKADGKKVAVKTLHRHLTSNETSVRRFKKEARLLAEVRTANVCQLLDFNQDKGIYYLVMEFLEGQSLGDFLAQTKKLSEPMAVAIVAEVARALGEAHRLEIVHRDVKPDNIMLIGPWKKLLENPTEKSFDSVSITPDNLGVKLCDFGLARHVDQSASLNLTKTGQFVGTPLYMSPEQASGSEEVTQRSDVYSLGVTLFHLLTGQPPFKAANLPALVAMHVRAAVPSPQDLNKDLGGAVCQIVQKAMAKEPHARYADASEMLLDLERTMRGEPTALAIHPRLPSADKGSVLEYDWTFELSASPQQLWPFISNTERLNQAVGIPAVLYSLRLVPPQDSSLSPRAERTGTFRKAGFTNTWLEHPFEWVEGRRMSVLREYSEGIFSWLATITELSPRADGGTTLHHRVRIVPRGLLGRLVAALEVGLKGRLAVQTVYRRIDAFLTQKLPLKPSTDPFVSTAAHPVKDGDVVRRFVDKLTSRDVAPALAEDLVEFFLSGPEQEITRIRPIGLAQRLGHNTEEVIAACLKAAHEGILVILWDILCPKCRVASAIEETLRNIESHGQCQACNLDFELDFANSVELIFRVNPKLRPSELGVFCVGGPVHSPHVVAQVRVGASERLELALSLEEGSYRLRGPQLPYFVDFRVSPGSHASRGELRLEKGLGLDFPRTLRPGTQTVLFYNDFAAEVLVRVERLAAREDALTAARVSALASFRELFPQEVLAGKQLVSVAHVTLLATDLVDAAGLYERLGDTRAFGVLHEYFRILEDRIRRESGALVKTINEGMLAAFDDPAAAVQVALDLQGLIAANATTQGLVLGVGVHQGPAMVATINGKLDYFGSAVKLALRLPFWVNGSGVVLTRSLASDPLVQALLLDRGLICEVIGGAANMPNDGPYYLVGAKPKNRVNSRPTARSSADERQFTKTPVA